MKNLLGWSYLKLQSIIKGGRKYTFSRQGKWATPEHEPSSRAERFFVIKAAVFSFSKPSGVLEAQLK